MVLKDQDTNRWELGLERISSALRRLGDPQKNYRTVLVGGTNGKGSTAVFLERILMAGGVRTGLNISPHVSRFNERFRLSGAEISAAELAEAENALKGSLADMDLTYFEWCVALAAYIFAEKGVDVGIFEIGLGGRLDAANAIDADVAVITNVALDHTDYLGDTVAAIAAEKAAIARAQKPLVTSAEGDGLRVIREYAVAVGACLHEVNGLQVPAGLSLPHQQLNAALALKCSELLGIKICDKMLIYALGTAFLPGRIEAVGRRIIMDVAHNAASMLRLQQYLDQSGFNGNAVVGFLADKDYRLMLKMLGGHCRRIFAAPVASVRSWTVADIRAAAPENLTCCESLQSAFERAAEEGGDILITGSFYTVGELRDKIICIG